jgi:AraC-like DNA-binding protein
MQTAKLVSRIFHSDRWRETAMHAHRNGQFTFVRRGLVNLETEAGIWVVPPGRLAWIPPRLRHASRSRGPVEGWLVLAAPSYARHLPRQVSVLKAQPLLIAALDRIGQPMETDLSLARAIEDLVLLEVAKSEAEDIGIPLPVSPPLRAWAGRFLEAPDAKASIDAGAAATGMSRRSFTRHFEQETGRTFSDWKRLVMVQHAIERLANGERVAAIAFDIGYENPSAFIAMFKAMRGMPPRQFVGFTGDRA